MPQPDDIAAAPPLEHPTGPRNSHGHPIGIPHSGPMRRITYAGDTVITTDDVAEALVELTAAVANYGRAEAVRIPIVMEEDGDSDEAELVIGVGNDVLSAPVKWDGAEPDFSAGAEELRSHSSYPVAAPVAGHLYAVDDAPTQWDPDLEGFRDA